MTVKGVFQTIGTVSSLLLAFITIKFTEYNQVHDVAVSSPNNLWEFFLVIATVGIMMITGFSYYNSRLEYDGPAYFLFALVGWAHTLLAPIAVVIASMKIEFGQYWWAVLIGIIILLIYGNGYKNARN